MACLFCIPYRKTERHTLPSSQQFQAGDGLFKLEHVRKGRMPLAAAAVGARLGWGGQQGNAAGKEGTLSGLGVQKLKALHLCN